MTLKQKAPSKNIYPKPLGTVPTFNFTPYMHKVGPSLSLSFYSDKPLIAVWPTYRLCSARGVIPPVTLYEALYGTLHVPPPARSLSKSSLSMLPRWHRPSQRGAGQHKVQLALSWELHGNKMRTSSFPQPLHDPVSAQSYYSAHSSINSRMKCVGWWWFVLHSLLTLGLGQKDRDGGGYYVKGPREIMSRCTMVVHMGCQVTRYLFIIYYLFLFNCFIMGKGGVGGFNINRLIFYCSQLRLSCGCLWINESYNYNNGIFNWNAIIAEMLKGRINKGKGNYGIKDKNETMYG